MKAFHEHYMPSNAILRPVMEMFLGMDIRMIAPQHGSVIRGDVKPYIKALRDLECGMFLEPVRKELAKSGGYRSVFSRVIKRYEAVFSREEVLDVVEGLEMTLDDDLEVTDYMDTGNSLWNRLFEAALAKKGLAWLLVIEPLVRTIAREYDIPVPEVFNGNLKKAGEESLQLSRENALLKEINARLSRSLHEAEEKLIRDPLTRLYNQDFFRSYFTSEVRTILSEDSQQNPCLVIISLDNMEKVRFQYGENEVQETLKNTAYILEDILEEGSMLFRLNGERIACYLPHSEKAKATAFAEKARTAISSSKKFAEKVTASIGVVSLDGIRDRSVHIKEPAERMYGVGLRRAKIARKMGMDIVCSSSSVEEFRDESGRILIVDNDEVNIDILKLFLESTGFQVVTAKDGEEALNYADDNPPDLIISEIMLPKMDGFLLREKLNQKSHTKNIPFIITSHLKDNDSVQRAASLSIAHYFKKPYMLSEIVGLIRNRVRGEIWK
jgi:diguanylate cyclase (GGDEF)-like protein